MKKEVYDVYYSTGGGSLVYGGSDVWVNNWLREVAPKLDYPSKLLIHRRNPNNIKIDFDSPIEIVWQGDHPRDFEEIAAKSRKIHVLHGYYTPHKIIEHNKDKIEYLATHFECSTKEAKDYLSLLDKKTINNIIKNYKQ